MTSPAKSLQEAGTSEVMSRMIFSLVPLVVLCSLSGIANPSPAETVIDVGSKKQLFIDDWFVEFRDLHGDGDPVE